MAAADNSPLPVCAPCEPGLPCAPAAPAGAPCPVLLVAAPSSGQGKTTVTAALARFWSRQGLRVQVFKCGPDFIDAGWHALASGQSVYQLDLWMAGAAACRAMLQHACMHNDVVLVEGVMGLFDGEPSSADVAVQFGLPVLTVVDAGRMAGTLGAVIYGLQHYQQGLPWAGVLANRVASANHAQMLRESLREPAHWLGGIARSEAFTLGSRHLGLLQAHELHDALQRLDAAADALADTPMATMSAAQLQQFRPSRLWEGQASGSAAASTADTAPISRPSGASLGTANRTPSSTANGAPSATSNATPHGVLSAYLQTQIPSPILQGRTIAIARDAACCFIYPANLETLQALGAKLVFFSPLADASLPACDALWLPGGYPELHLPQLAANTAMRQSVAQHIAAGKPVWAEGGGMLLLCQSIAPAQAASATPAQSHAASAPQAATQAIPTPAAEQPAWGILPATAHMHSRLQGLGLQALVEPAVTAAGGAQELDSAQATGAQGAEPQHPPLRGHTFHYASISTALPELARTTSARANSRNQAGEALYQYGPAGNVWASHFHPWFASSPQAAAQLFLPRLQTPLADHPETHNPTPPCSPTTN